MSKLFVRREELLEAIERVIDNMSICSEHNNEGFELGYITSLERLKHELGYSKMISRKAIRNSSRKD